MPTEFILPKDDQYVLNHCARYLARSPDSEARHDYGQFGGDPVRSRVCESWRFPLVDSYSDGADFEGSYAFNRVTFVYAAPDGAPPSKVSVVGTFGKLYEPVPLARVRAGDADTPYFAVTLVVPKGEVHTYKYLVDGKPALDPINPQRVKLSNGREWSRFFTHLCSLPVVLERWEMSILNRITAHILPFETEESENFLRRFYEYLDKQSKETQYAHAYRLDQPVGVVNFIDKLLAKEENHHLIDYRLCLDIIERLLRKRNPYVEPALMSKEMYRDLYQQMADGNVPGWEYGRYNSPRYFLQLLRRHTLTGAFSHPKYGGNVGAVGWAYLEERFRDDKGRTLFDWRRSIERPLGDDATYHG
jgi:hypothetical protein